MDEGLCRDKTREVDDNPPTSYSSRKRKKPDEGDSLLAREELLVEQPIENEYEHLEDDDDVEDEEVTSKMKTEYKQILTAQEPSTIKQYDDIKVTPFNLEEECEEGEFDKAGNFVFAKRSSFKKPVDTWAESIDWAAVEKSEREQKYKKELNVEHTTRFEPGIAKCDKSTCYKQMLRIMRPDETVQKTIRRLGNLLPRRNLTKHGSKSNKESNLSNQSEFAEVRKSLDTMIELAHRRLEDGDMDIYQKNYDELEAALG